MSTTASATDGYSTPVEIAYDELCARQQYAYSDSHAYFTFEAGWDAAFQWCHENNKET